MKAFFALFSDSAKELTRVRSLTTIGVLLALQSALSLLTIPIGEAIKVSPGFLVSGLIGALFGPVPAAIAGAASDLIGWMIHPTGPLHLGFTLTAALSGMAYGVALYKYKCTWWRVIVSKTFVNLVLNCVLNTIWLLMLYGQGVAVKAALRVLKNLVALPLEVVALYFLLRAVLEVLKKNRLLDAK